VAEPGDAHPKNALPKGGAFQFVAATASFDDRLLSAMDLLAMDPVDLPHRGAAGIMIADAFHLLSPCATS
jgi:hypothetical protein